MRNKVIAANASELYTAELHLTSKLHCKSNLQGWVLKLRLIGMCESFALLVLCVYQ